MGDESLKHLTTLLDDPWAVALVVVSLVVGFLGWLFREVIKEGILWRLKSKRERAGRIAEAERLFNPGEREILAVMAKGGGQLRISTEDVMERHPNPITVRFLNDERRMKLAKPEDVFALKKRSLIDGSYGLTERGRAEGEDMIRLFGLPDCLKNSPVPKEE